MCQSIEEAEQNCQRVYGHKSVAQPDHMPDGHYYSAPEDLVWVIHPEDDIDAEEGGMPGPGVTGIRNGAKPLCKL